MNIAQLQERLRSELLRRIERGSLSVSLLARQTGLGQAHLSNFLHAHRGLSIGTFDRILAAQKLTVEDLLPAPRLTTGTLLDNQVSEAAYLPLVSHSAAAFEPYIRPSIVQSMIPLPASSVKGLLERCTPARKQWERFVAIRVSAEDARPMLPLLFPDALLVLDRHYNSFRPYREAEIDANVYAIRIGPDLKVRYADLQAGRLILRPLGFRFPIDVIEPTGAEPANDLIVGRVALILRES